MRIYTLRFHKKALADVADLKKSDQPAFKKLNKLLEELQTHPYSGTGKPEPLKHGENGIWSRRITQKHRLVYTVNDEEISVWIVSAQSHYGDK